MRCHDEVLLVELIRNIEEFKRQLWTYKEISDHLHSKGFTSRLKRISLSWSKGCIRSI